MKPNFALNLSHEGISLLHRATAGWSRVGDVALDDPDLNEHLRLLRKTATDLESGGLTSKLVIPDSQILYTEVDAPGPDTAARIAQIRDGLVGLTPYDVEDLVFDWRMAGGKAQVAVVARETLQEAEAFAADFRFNPVSFVAVPDPGAFDGEPYFGPTQHAADLLDDGEVIEPDSTRLEIAEPGQTPDSPAKADAPPAARIDDPEPEPELDPEPEKPAKAAKKAKAKPREKTKAKRKVPPVKAEATDTAEHADAPLTFSSRRTAHTGPDTAPKLAPLPPPPAAFPAESAAALDLDDVPEMPAWRNTNKSEVTPMPVTAAHTADPLPATTKKSDSKAVRDAAKAAGGALAGALGKLGKGSADSLRGRKDLVAASASEAESLTVFGARGSRSAGKPRYLGLTLTLALILALGVLALWSSFFLGEDGAAQLPDPDVAPVIATDPDQPNAEPEGEVEVAAAERPANDPAPEVADPAGDPIDAAVETALQDTPTPDPTADTEDLALLLQPETPAVNPPPDRISQPPPTLAEAETSYAATGIWQLDPDPPPEANGGDRLEQLSVAGLDTQLSATNMPNLPTATSLGGDLRPATLTPPPALGTRYDLDERGLVRATPEGALSPDGIRIIAGLPPVVPGVRPGSALPAPADPALSETETPVADLPETPETPALDPEIERLRSIRPPARPDTLDETRETTAGNLSASELALIRPVMRPRSIQEQAATTAPATGSEPESEAAPTPSIDEESATDLAVAASLSPAVRPSSIAAAVERALAENPPQREADVDVAAARVPSIPTRASVAKQATVRNAINLRKINLIGVYGSSSDRRALIRLKSGRYVKVEVGDRIDGGRVAAIGDSELRYVKGGRNITLTLPKG